jgi:hypothetical protein
MTNYVNLNGSNYHNRNCITANLNGSNYADIIATKSSNCNGSNYKYIEAPFNVINGSNDGTAKGHTIKGGGANNGTAEGHFVEFGGANNGTAEGHFVEFGGANNGTAKGHTVKFGGANQGQVDAKQASVSSNLRGGRVIAEEIKYAGLRTTYDIITKMAIGGQPITHEFAIGITNGVPQTDIVTLIRTAEDRWTIEAQGVTNELTVLPSDRLEKNHRLQLRHLSGELRSIRISGSSFSGVSFSGGNVVSGNVFHGPVTFGRRRGW